MPRRGKSQSVPGAANGRTFQLKGFLKLSLVSVPVKAYTATTNSGGEIHLNQLHAECHSRIQYKKSCPIHGEVPQKDIVSGYEHAKDQYVVIDTDELEKLRTEDDKAITIDTFIEPDALDPVYLSGTTYYLLPDGPIGQKPYAVLHEGTVQQNGDARQGTGDLAPPDRQPALHGNPQLRSPHHQALDVRERAGPADDQPVEPAA